MLILLIKDSIALKDYRKMAFIGLWKNYIRIVWQESLDFKEIYV